MARESASIDKCLSSIAAPSLPLQASRQTTSDPRHHARKAEYDGTSAKRNATCLGT
jgi:hypothetical protein